MRPFTIVELASDANHKEYTYLCIWFIKGIGSVYKRHPVSKFEHGNHGASKRKFNHMTVY